MLFFLPLPSRFSVVEIFHRPRSPTVASFCYCLPRRTALFPILYLGGIIGIGLLPFVEDPFEKFEIKVDEFTSRFCVGLAKDDLIEIIAAK